MYLLGWVTAGHVLRWWPGRLRRLSGGALATLFVLLTVSGFALFFVSDDRWQRGSVFVHDVLGLGVTVFCDSALVLRQASRHSQCGFPSLIIALHDSQLIEAQMLVEDSRRFVACT